MNESLEGLPSLTQIVILRSFQERDSPRKATKNSIVIGQKAYETDFFLHIFIIKLCYKSIGTWLACIHRVLGALGRLPMHSRS